ncbi:MAG TPA: ComEC/Rec2 family competence protein [Solirubrobacteraceae bacterium]|nr:ComEC/Rec2 family competence protein [Solirubrobacteraceae bacterium]
MRSERAARAAVAPGARLLRAGVHAVGSALAAARGHPRHIGLFALAAGLALGPVSRAATLGAALLAAAAAGRRAVALVAGAAVLVGAVIADARLAALDSGSLAAMSGQRWEGRAVVLEPVRERGGHASARVRLIGLGEAAVVRLRVPGAGRSRRPWPEVGEVVALAGRVAPLGRYDAYQGRRGAHAALEVDRLHATGTWRGGLAGGLDRVRRRAERGLARGLPGEEAALLRGMVLGQDERLSEAVRTDFERSGLAHLLAVSGQNVVLLAMLVLAVGMLTGLGLRARLAAALGLVVLYVPLAGGGPSIQRAGVMGGAGLVAALAGRPASRWYALGLAAVFTLALNPRASGEPGWQLSFAAVVGLLALVPRWREGLRRARLPGPLADAAAVTGAATVATAPLMAFHFEQVSLASLPANLVAAPAVAPVMWLGMVAIAAAQVSPALCVPLNALNGPLLAYLEWVAHVAAQPPAAALPVRLGGPAGLALAYAAGAALLALAAAAWRRAAPLGPRRTAAVAGLAAAGGLLLLVPALDRPRPPQRGEFVVSFLDIGQGDATLLQHDGASVLVDTGPPGGPILRRLAEAGVERLDALLLTHAQADHEGMALEVVRAFRPRLVLDGGTGWSTPVRRGLPATRARTVAAHAGQSLSLGGIRLRLLWPPRPPPGWRADGDPNDRAVVALASVGSFDVLLPADAESDVTSPLELPRVEALKVAHHGSDDAGLPALLARTEPAFAAIEVGRGNTYGHPTASTLAALRAAVPRVVRTDRDGTVRLRVTRAGARIERSP